MISCLKEGYPKIHVKTATKGSTSKYDSPRKKYDHFYATFVQCAPASRAALADFHLSVSMISSLSSEVANHTTSVCGDDVAKGLVVVCRRGSVVIIVFECTSSVCLALLEWVYLSWQLPS